MPEPTPAANGAAVKAAMTPPAPPKKEPATAPPAEEGKTIRVRAHERAIRMKEKIASEERSEAEAEPAKTGAREPEAQTKDKPAAEKADAKASPAAKPKEKAEPEERERPRVKADATEDKPEPSDDDKRRAERQERIVKRQELLRKAADRERAEQRERESRRQYREPERDSELEQLRKRVAELEPNEAAFKSEEALLAAAEGRGLSTTKLVEWMKRRLSDPNAVGQHHARTVEETLRAEIQQERQERQALERRIREEREHAERAMEGERKARKFVEMSTKGTDSHPLTARFLERHGQMGLVAFANQFIAPILRPGYDLEELHDHVEQFLDEVQDAKPGAQAGKSHPAKNGADQPTTTLSNRDASERVSVTEEIPMSRLPRAERVARLKSKLARAPED